MGDDTQELVESIMGERQKSLFEDKGEVDFSFGIPALGRFRVNAFRQRGTVAAAFRLVSTEVPTPEFLGLPQSVIDLYQKNSGLVLVTGPTGSGKSTTLASLIQRINETRRNHIITLEDPIEYLYRHSKSLVNQREIGLDTRSYAAALRAALREDPDVILVGEMRDLETISTSITAAETGHLVFSTLHTIGAASTIDRIIDVFPAEQKDQIRGPALHGYGGCHFTEAAAEGDGSGRTGVFEVMHVNTAVRSLIRTVKPISPKYHPDKQESRDDYDGRRPSGKIQGRHYHTKDAGRLCGGSGVDRKTPVILRRRAEWQITVTMLLPRPGKKKRESSQRQTGPTRWRY